MLKQLKIVSGPFKGIAFELKSSEILVGRSEDCDWVITDPDISRNHMKVTVVGDVVKVIDHDSTNGVYLNRQKVFEPTELQNGDIILIGQSALLFSIVQDALHESGISGRFDVDKMPTYEEIKTSLIMPCIDAKDLPGLVHNAIFKQKLETLYKICSEGSRFTDLVAYFDFVFKALAVELQYRKIIALRLNEDLYEVVHFYQTEEVELELDDLSQTIINYSIENQQVLFSNYAQGDNRFKSSESLRRQLPLAIMCAPLIVDGKVLGAVSMDVENFKKVFSNEDMMLFSACVANLAWALNHNIMMKQLVEKQRKEADLRIAREIQGNCIPDISRLPIIQGVDLAAWYKPYEIVGGDYFEVYKSGNNLVLINADVSGKGVSASLVVSLLKAYLKTILINTSDPSSILCGLHHLLDGDLPKKMFVTMSVATIDLKTKKVAYARAGHTYLLHYVAESQTYKLIGGKGIMLGVASTDIFKTRLEKVEFSLNRNDMLFLYTDGYVEARNNRDDQFGEDRLGECLQTFSKLDAKTILEKVDSSVMTFTHQLGSFDDMCGILLKFLG